MFIEATPAFIDPPNSHEADGPRAFDAPEPKMPKPIAPADYSVADAIARSPRSRSLSFIQEL